MTRNILKLQSCLKYELYDSGRVDHLLPELVEMMCTGLDEKIKCRCIISICRVYPNCQNSRGEYDHDITDGGGIGQTRGNKSWECIIKLSGHWKIL